jgi:hypothetical protein
MDRTVNMELIYEDDEYRHYSGVDYDLTGQEVTIVFERPFCDNFPTTITMTIKGD